jgi:hypothetical protein
MADLVPAIHGFLLFLPRKPIGLAYFSRSTVTRAI